MSDKKIKAWLPPRFKGETAASVDGIKLGYGKDNAVEVTESQLERLRVGTKGIETEAPDSSKKDD